MSQTRRLRTEGKRKVGSKPDADVQSRNRLRLSPGAEKILVLLLVAATLAGLYFDFSLALMYPLTSDMANAGLFPMEVMQGNFEYVLPANNPYIFTDYIIHMVIQPLTGYSHVALALTGYGIFVMIVLSGAALVWRLAGRVEAAAAAAMIANMPFMGLIYVLYPLYHNGTILFILLSLLVYYSDRPPLRLSFRSRVLIIGVLQFLGVFSDTLMLPLFTAPLMAYAAYRILKQRMAKETEKGDGEKEDSPVLLLASAVPALIIYVVKSRIGQLWPGGPILAASGADLGSPGNLFQHTEMLYYYFAGLINNAGGIFIAIILLFLVVATILDRRDRFLHAVLVLGGLFMIIGFMSMDIAGDPARYLTPISIMALIVAATWTMRRDVGYLPLVAVTIIVLAGAWPNGSVIFEDTDPDFIRNQQAFVTLLESENITHAYADYWTANVYTYLSGGKIMIEPVNVEDDKLRFQMMNSAPRWANIWPDGTDTRPVVIALADSDLDAWAKKVNENHPPEEIHEFEGGWIYVYNGTLPAWPAGE
ncbi:hypothetical protein [Methanocella arvoryzae]|uniref:Glycosyltransferase RgtA/B/C/D-like domain-containing protein n=1 Tax=Methanocella arvoryzae (strain DSM 22066 / NBRC 105507 / MRE50) TaxID=351160 RepID=Q0W6V7_METAR|nr:hypothetical protein [Methanocella arvoryzae]CAJ35886.1 hypothetical protein RCIX456 [Methanocella arvoryzae MRE50]